MEKEELLFEKRLIDLSNQAFHQNRITFTDFLNRNELNIFHTSSTLRSLSKTSLFGGYELAERQMIAFLPEALYCDLVFPMAVIQIEPSHLKFSDKLTHRDYLGAILNLGIDRCKIGDILAEQEYAYVFCHEQMSDFIIQELSKIKHTAIQCKRVELTDFHYEPSFIEVSGTVASVRLDSLLSLAFGASRSKLADFIQKSRVFVNGKLILSNGYEVKEEDIVSVRGLGKFIYKGTSGRSRKERIYVTIQKYN